jgi:hypothetical protein
MTTLTDRSSASAQELLTSTAHILQLNHQNLSERDFTRQYGCSCNICWDIFWGFLSRERGVETKRAYEERGIMGVEEL